MYACTYVRTQSHSHTPNNMHLKPDLDMALCKGECPGKFHSACPADVLVEMEFLLEFEQLSTSVGRPCPLVFVERVGIGSCRQTGWDVFSLECHL